MSLELTMFNLIQTNNGKFKSDKQAAFLIKQTENMQIVTHGMSFDKSWTDFWLLDNDGIVSQTRRMKSGKTVEKWNRDGNSETQIKNKKSAERHNAKIEQHKLIAIDAEKYYNELCLAEFGYVVCPKMKDKCWSAISIAENTPFHKMWANEFGEINTSIESDWKTMVDFITNGDYETIVKMRDEYKSIFMDMADKLLKIRCDVMEKYPTKYCYSFM